MPIAAEDLVCIQEIFVAGTTVYVGQIPNAALALALWAVCLRDMSVVVRLARTVFRLPAQPVPPVALAGVIPPKRWLGASYSVMEPASASAVIRFGTPLPTYKAEKGVSP